MLKRSRRDGKNTWKNCIKKAYGYGGVVSHPEPDILRAKSSGPSEILLLIKLEDATEFQRTIQEEPGRLQSMGSQRVRHD